MTEQSDESTGHRVPTCSKCKEKHYNFQSCSPRQDLKPEIRWQKSEELDRWISLKHLGGNTFVQRREYDR